MKFTIVGIMCLLSLPVLAAQQAVTDTGEVVILNDDGTWVYLDRTEDTGTKIPTNLGTFTLPKQSTFNLKSTKTNSQFTINPKVWRFSKNEGKHDAAEYTFELKNGDLYGLAISEQIEIGIEQLADIALDNARNAAPDIKIVKKEYRVVNGNKVIYMEMLGTIQGVKFKYLGYYYSDDSGSTQYLTYTGANLVEKYQTDIENFLNGFSVQ